MASVSPIWLTNRPGSDVFFDFRSVATFLVIDTLFTFFTYGHNHLYATAGPARSMSYQQKVDYHHDYSYKNINSWNYG